MKKASKTPASKKICVVFVCTGNTCRSPVAERIFKHLLKKEKRLSGFRVLSAGLSADNGDGMSALSSEVLKEAGISAGNHKSRFLSSKIIDAADFIVCMTESHKRALAGLKNPHVYTVAEITGGSDVTDPYGGTVEEYRRMFDYLMYAMPEVEEFIRNKVKGKK